jgi:hypothetical protein
VSLVSFTYINVASLKTLQKKIRTLTLNCRKPVTQESRKQQVRLSMLREMTSDTLVDVMDRFGILNEENRLLVSIFLARVAEKRKGR